MATYGVFSVPDAKRIAAATKRVEGSPGTFVRVPERVSRLGASLSALVRDAELTASLSAASNSKTGASTAAAKFLVADPDNPGDLMDGAAFTVTNRSLDASGLSGDYIIVARIGDEWRLIWIDC